MNLFDMLKASKGIPVSDPMAMLWGYQYRKKHSLSEISGVPPLHFTSRGEQLLDYRIYGNTVQNGTPTPENPVEVLGSGEQTENLFDKSATNTNNGYISDGYLKSDGSKNTNGDYRASEYIAVSPKQSYTLGYGSALDKPSVCFYDNSKNFISGVAYSGKRTVPFTTPQNTAFLRLSFRTIDFDKVMLNTGSTLLPYEPYGYKIPVMVSNGTNALTTPIYIGNKPLHRIGDYADYVDYKRGVVVRRIKKLVLTEEEGWTNQPLVGVMCVSIPKPTGIPASATNLLCTAFSVTSSSTPPLYSFYVGGNWINFNYDGINDIQTFQSYLVDQYIDGTPVTVWYVLAEPEEEPLENLLPIQTIKGTNILTVGTTVQPSNIWIKGKIKAIN